MKKEIIYDKNARKELDNFSQFVREDFFASLDALEQKGKLEFPETRKITNDIFEIRVSREGVYRGFYAYIKHPDIVVLHFFQKKSQKTPIKNIKTAISRLQCYK